MSTLKVNAIQHVSASTSAITLSSDGTAAVGAITQNAQTGTAYTFVLADAGKIVSSNNASAVTFTIPPQSSVAWPTGAVLNVVNYGAGVVTFAGGSGVTVTNTAATLSQYQSAALIRTGSNAWTVVPFSGGASDLTAANVSATTGSPTITTSGGFTIYSYTGSGSFTTNRPGLCDVLVVGGGGGGGNYFGGGGGGGGVLYVTSYFLPPGTHTVVVGAGGAVGATNSPGSNGETSRFQSLYGVGGGAGGTGYSGGRGFFGGSAGGNAGSTTTVIQGVSGQGNSNGGRQYNAGGAGGPATTDAAGGAGPGLSNSITGSAITYGAGGGVSTGTPTANRGGGGQGDTGNGASGVVIIRVRS